MSVNPAAGSWSPADNLHAVALSEAGAWKEAVMLCAARVRTGGLNQQTDARLFLLALRQFLKAARLAADAVAGSSEAQALAAAQDQFNQTVPGAKNACDVIEHFREYAKGTGNLQQPGVNRPSRLSEPVAAARDWPLGYNPGTGSILLGQYEIGVAAACEQVKALQLAIWRAVRTG